MRTCELILPVGGPIFLDAGEGSKKGKKDVPSGYPLIVIIFQRLLLDHVASTMDCSEMMGVKKLPLDSRQ